MADVDEKDTVDERRQSALLCVGYISFHYTLSALIMKTVDGHRVLDFLGLLNVFLPASGLFLLWQMNRANKRIPRGCEACGCACKCPFLPFALAGCALVSFVQAGLGSAGAFDHGVDAVEVTSVVVAYFAALLLSALVAFWFRSLLVRDDALVCETFGEVDASLGA
eukprot:CAMPEP_0171094692 /NCGR_PEP_ID=MMETSP0766_2-20121228/42058_1 /TAXON_ID=439317 /ORGANISM="Gambierdiscus australes, Strain CAWD 149" /LENGTH=165 /DNA_ID=CAMNT_0011553387 /DNA_START=63 /DNA_END=560 /DNA_ORIENTATION=+